MFLTPLQARIYVAAWAALCLGAVALVARERRAYAFLTLSYVRFLLVPARAVPFAIAFAFFCFAAPYVGDPTWDRANGGAMALFTYLSAPWAVGALHRVATRRLPARQAIVAVAAWLFSASFCYDAYLYWRDGRYPQSFLWNMAASSTVYLLAGLFFSVCSPGGRGVALVFRLPEWFEHEGARRIGRLALLFGVVLALVVVASMAPFLRTMLGR
jgi:hypothetical protein